VGHLELCEASDHQRRDGGGNSMIQSLRLSARGLPNSALPRTRVLFHLGRRSSRCLDAKPMKSPMSQIP
jgi:hypothetical protein